MGLLDRLRRPEPPVDRAALRDEMTRDDPDFAHVRDVQHDAMQALTANGGAGQLRDRFNERVRRSWHPHAR